MAFNRLMLTSDGTTLEAKAKQGKKLLFTRVALGDGDIGSGSLINRTALISEKMSLLIDDKQVINETESAIIVTLKNDDLTEGFSFREIGILAQDPDTLEEKLYLYDNAGTECEPIPSGQSGVKINERLKLLIKTDNMTDVSFVASGNPLNLTIDNIDDSTTGANILWSSNKIKSLVENIFLQEIAPSEPNAQTVWIQIVSSSNFSFGGIVVANGVVGTVPPKGAFWMEPLE